MPRITLTPILITLNIAVYVYASIVGGNFIQPFEKNHQLLLLAGQVNAFVMKGWYWQLLTSMFVHVDVSHLFGNMLFLLIFGLRAEELFRPEEYLSIFFVSGLFGNFLTLFLHPFVPSAGASGAIFGIFGACVIYLRRSLGQSVIGALIYSFFLLMISAGSGINTLAHFGGLAAGLMIGYYLAKNRSIALGQSG